MPTNEKELNCTLFDQLFIIERILEAMEDGDIEKARKAALKEKQNVEKKLYQNPSRPEEIR